MPLWTVAAQAEGSDDGRGSGGTRSWGHWVRVPVLPVCVGGWGQESCPPAPPVALGGGRRVPKAQEQPPVWITLSPGSFASLALNTQPWVYFPIFGTSSIDERQTCRDRDRQAEKEKD